MNSELDALEVKVEQILALVHRLRAENEVLRNQLATAETERLSLRQRINTARDRLESLVDKLPEEA
ncbi:MAG TPA: hypothetical protein PKD04_00395 [Rhodocyclaceae bacterium]|jgi:uncharacterized protein (TIGR02449 family)|nr:hypothetical protein [Betaproteobacteria bacterium]HMU99504.1 hypothetical protein [Rhodocyclaceae bacterium]HMV20855.1 hypothetical protein [Rhodocyclaceae bacterium]HMW76686.1 hypothetical protein [Rhodocyclaceae bacterium]HNE41825.1 hypothetical protein [Rhodocyclaceae bacterium]